MPTYSYRCADCGHEFDQYQAFTDSTLTVCPNCGEPQLRKVFNSIGVSFTGSGFYRNDSRSDASGSKSSGALNATSDSSAAATASSGSGSGSGSGDSAAKSAPAAQNKSESKAATPAAATAKPATTS